jgi:hypothetical protein
MKHIRLSTLHIADEEGCTVAGLEKGMISRCFRLWQGDPHPLVLVIYKLIITQPRPCPLSRLTAPQCNGAA